MGSTEPQQFVVSFLEFDILKDVTTVRFTEKGKDPWSCEAHTARLSGNRLQDFNTLPSIDRNLVLEYEKNTLHL